ncbi:MAG: DUF4062 domain-containing protein [Pirellula sp.]
MKVFVSSTIYELIDVRSVVYETLTSLGITAVLSENNLSGFEVLPDKDSIRVCLTNVEASDVFVCILDRRYGPSLQSSGFEDVSATELEYNRAVECKKDIHFFVRDRLESDFSHWKKNGRSEELKYAWCEDPKLFKFLERHRKLNSELNRSNWITPFSHAVELSGMIRARFESQVSRKNILMAMHKNSFPMMSCSIIAKLGTKGIAVYHTAIKNIGDASAFDVQLIVNGNKSQVRSILPYREEERLDLWTPYCFVSANGGHTDKCGRCCVRAALDRRICFGRRLGFL